MEPLANVLQNLGFLGYGGPMVAFTLLIAAGDRIPHLKPWDVIRTYRAWGAGFGLSLGLCVLGGLSLYYLRTGGFSWGWDTSEEQVVTGTFLAFLAMWVSNIKLEIWTLDPLRKLDPNGVVSDEAAYRAAAASLRNHLVVHSLLVLLVAVLATISGIA